MPTKPTNDVKSIKSQADRRKLDTFHDQHRYGTLFPDGRPWCGYREKPSEAGEEAGFCGADLQPGDHLNPMASSWEAPWVPDIRYFDFEYYRRRITIRYDRVLADDRVAYQKHYDAAAVIAFQKGWDVPEIGRPLSFAIHAVLGDTPRSPKVAEAAKAGHPWLLGFSKDVDETLAAYLNMSRKGFAMTTPPVPTILSAESILTAKDAPDLDERIAMAVAKAMATYANMPIPRRRHRRTKPVSISSGAEAMTP